TAEMASQAVHLYSPTTAYRERGPGGFFGGGGARRNAGQNPPAGAAIDYYLASTPSGQLTLEVLDGQRREATPASSEPQGAGGAAGTGRQAAKRRGAPGGGALLPARAGLNRYVWNFREEGPVMVPGMAIIELQNGRGPLVPPGTYRLKLTAAGKEYTAPLEVKADPRVEASQADLERQYQLAVQIRDHITEIHNAVNRIREARANLEILRKRAGGSTAQAIDAAEQAMSAIEGELIQVRSVNRYAALVYPTMLDAEYANLANAI